MAEAPLDKDVNCEYMELSHGPKQVVTRERGGLGVWDT